MIVDTDRPVTLLGGGEVSDFVIIEALRLAPILVAADGAAGRALALGHVPEAVIGDFDSLDGAVRDRIPVERLFRIEEQDSTDFDKCLRSIRAPLVLAVGFAGARLDHELAAYSAMVAPGRPRCILIRAIDVCFAAPPGLEMTLNLAAGTRVSLFPLAPVQGVSRGLRWPIAGIPFKPAGPIGTSNVATGPVRMHFDAPGMLVILPREALPEAMAALR